VEAFTISGDAEAAISLVIPSVELKGSRAETLRKQPGELLRAEYRHNGRACLRRQQIRIFQPCRLVTGPLGKTTSFGAWNVHGVVEFQALGDTTKSFNGGEGHKTIVSGGIGFSY